MLTAGAQRLVDVAVSAVALLLLSPLMLLAALLVKLTSRGPVLYRASRLGRNGALFRQLKFRSMIVAAPDLRNPDGSTFNAEDDPRVTRIGRILRRTSIDELPQLLNVLHGEMSLVGPRPDPPDVLALYRQQDHARLSVKPGLTGWAVVHGRNALPWEKRRDLDLEYVADPSLRRYLSVLGRTVPLVLRRVGITGHRHAPQEGE
jgi:lipopolysaccharide/colanic/teichoic acid biosynthesis glycosyltransferase